MAFFQNGNIIVTPIAIFKSIILRFYYSHSTTWTVDIVEETFRQNGCQTTIASTAAWRIIFSKPRSDTHSS